jgi:nucleoside-diphosphate-sugar epimerase
MLSTSLTQAFYQDGHQVDVFGRREPQSYPCSTFTRVDLCEEVLDIEALLSADLIVYAAGAGVQAALNTNPLLMYQLNVNVPIGLTIRLKQEGYKGCYISFGSYMEIGLNDEDGKCFNEDEVICSILPVTNDYALSKRIYSRYMRELKAEYTYWHFILPNMFSYNDMKPGTRLIPYVLQYLRDYVQQLHPKAPSFSAGTQMRQYILQEEMPEVIRKAMERRIPSGIYNIGGGEYMSVRETIERLFEAYQVPCLDSYFGKEVRRDGDIRSLRIDGDKLYQAIGYLPNKKMCDL